MIESLVMLAAGYLSKVEKGPTVAIVVALVVGISEGIYHTDLFQVMVDAFGFHVYNSILTLLIIVMLSHVRAKVAMVVMVLCFLALLVNLLSFSIDISGGDSTAFFESAIYSIFALEVLAILSTRVTDGLFRCFNSIRLVRSYFADIGDTNRGRVK